MTIFVPNKRLKSEISLNLRQKRRFGAKCLDKAFGTILLIEEKRHSPLPIATFEKGEKILLLQGVM